MSETSDKNLPEKEKTPLETALGYRFKENALRDLAVTHSSSVQKKGANNERLEFLGDRVLGLAVAAALFHAFPDEKEGALAKRHAALVQESILAQIAEKLNLSLALRLSSAEAKAGGAKNKTILADALEAMIGAVFLDGGFAQAEKPVARLWQEHIKIESLPPSDPKTRLQELTQSKGLSLPQYRVVSRTGTDHKPVFTIELTVEKVGSVTAEDQTKRAAEKRAAEKMLTDMADKIEKLKKSDAKKKG